MGDKHLGLNRLSGVEDEQLCLRGHGWTRVRVCKDDEGAQVKGNMDNDNGMMILMPSSHHSSCHH